MDTPAVSVDAIATPTDTVGSSCIADAPFDDTSTTDVIIRTQDGVDFYAYKCILSLASPFFKHMFTLDQPPSPTGNRQSVVDVSETSEIVDGILRFCYPVFEPNMSAISTVIELLAMARKYDMQAIIPKLKVPLRSFLSTSPLQIFALACRYQLEDIAGEAAIAWRHDRYGGEGSYDGEWDVTASAKSYIAEMADIPSGVYFRLVRYLRTNTSPASYCHPPPTPDTASTESVPRPQSPLARYGSSYVQLALDTDVIISSIDGVRFPAHKMILCAASRVLRGLLVISGDQQMKILNLAENGDALAIVLRSCYPGGMMLESDIPISVVASVLAAASKYELPVLEEAAKRKLEDGITLRPLEVYLRAVGVGWKDGSRAAAVHLSRLPESDLYHPLMETMSAKYYHALLKFRFEYRKALVRCFTYGEYRRDVFEGQLWDEWMWDECIGGIHPELIVAFAANTRYGYSNGSRITPVNQLRNFEGLKYSILSALSQIQLDIAWDDLGTSASSES